MISRHREYIKHSPSKDARKIYVVCEGIKAEPAYYGFFENLSSNLELVIIPSQEGKTDPLKLIDLAQQNFEGVGRKYLLDYMQQDKVWFAIDTDDWEKQGKIKMLRDFCKEKNSQISTLYDEAKPYEAWNVVQCNPCFEVWLYYHLYENKPNDTATENYPSIKDFVNNKISGGFDFREHPVFLPEAIVNAKANFVRSEDGRIGWFSTEKFLLGQEILKFVQPQLAKLRRKM
ncbi:MAG: RloB family protein [Bacteroidales bacterium]|nr:RloB family protein [Bacteroidales bacterium]